MTEELGMRSVSYLYGKKRSIIKAFMANNDIVCCKYSNKFIESVISGVVKCVNRGIIKIEDIDSSIKRIEDMKKKYKFNDKTQFDKIDVNRYNATMEK